MVKCNHKSHPGINAFVTENTNEWDSIKQQSIDTTNCTQMKLRFLNNPYRFNSSNNVAIYIDQALVFKGSFASIFNLYIPNKYFANRLLPAFTIYDGKKAYNFIHKASMYLDAGDKYLYVVFFPDNELTEGSYMLSQKEEIL